MANDGRGGRVTPHDPAVRAEALELASRVGKKAAADGLGISVNTISSWQKRASEKSFRELAKRGFSLPVTRGTSWQARRAELLLGLADLAQESLAAAREAVREGRSKAAQEFSSVLVRAVDRAELLGGLPTSRSESRSLAFQVQSEAGLAQVKKEGAAVVMAGRAKLEHVDNEGEGEGDDG